MSTVFQKFAEKWAVEPISRAKQEPVLEEAFRISENALGIIFPQAFKDFMLLVGPVWTPHVLTSTVELQSKHRDDPAFYIHALQNIDSLSEAARESRAWQSHGLPVEAFAFGYDCMGNKFFFDITECVHPRPKDLAVYFWDHDFNTTEEVAKSFTAFIQQYVDLEKAEG